LPLRSEFASQRKATLGLYRAIGVNYAAYKTENRFEKLKRRTFPFVVTIIPRRFEPRISAEFPLTAGISHSFQLYFGSDYECVPHPPGRFAVWIAPDWMLQQNAVSEGAERSRAAAMAHRQNCVLLNQSSIFF
jgi:hypothetical protein